MTMEVDKMDAEAEAEAESEAKAEILGAVVAMSRNCTDGEEEGGDDGDGEADGDGDSELLEAVDAAEANSSSLHGRNFFPELQSPNPLVRQAAQNCIGLLVNLSGRLAIELLMPHRNRMLVGIFTKLLRALPFSKQIGMIEAIRYCVSLEPPLVELNDELLCLLHETLALADADDVQLLGPRSIRQGGFEVITL
jgi:hypothetical protein